jgi:hypothetical protein
MVILLSCSRSLIVALGEGVSPATVVRRVAFVVVDAVYGEVVSVAVGYRPITEGREVIEPLRADGDVTTTVVLILRVFLV